MSTRYGQHFLTNRHAIERIVEALQLDAHSHVFEIGPGKGALTGPLLERANSVTAVEVDAQMKDFLLQKFSNSSHFNLLHMDILEFNLDLYRQPARSRTPIHDEPVVFTVVGNLPYNLTSPILRKLSEWTQWSTAHVMVQREVANRMCAKEGNHEYGALTVGVQLTSQVEKVFDLSENSFSPPPKVKSSVVKLTRREFPLTRDVVRTQRVIQAAFQQRRKTILNALSHGLNMSKEDIGKILLDLNINETSRAENISVYEYVRLGELLAPLL